MSASAPPGGGFSRLPSALRAPKPPPAAPEGQGTLGVPPPRPVSVHVRSPPTGAPGAATQGPTPQQRPLPVFKPAAPTGSPAPLRQATSGAPQRRVPAGLNRLERVGLELRRKSPGPPRNHGSRSWRLAGPGFRRKGEPGAWAFDGR